MGLWTVSYLRSRRDARREKSVTFLDEIAKPLNSILTELFRCTRLKKIPPDDALPKSLTALYQQRLAVQIKSEAFLNAPQFSKDYDSVISELDRIVQSVSKPGPDFARLETETEAVWKRTRMLLSEAISNALKE